jgi:hypothetical protein
MPNDKPQGLTHAERQDVEELSAPRSPVIYEVVRQQGEDELAVLTAPCSGQVSLRE